MKPGPETDDLEDGGPCPYRVVNGDLVRVARDRDGNEVFDLIANFEARILEEVTFDDGVERTLVFRIGGRLKDGTVLRDALVPATEFAALGWLAQNWGARAVVYAGTGRRDHLRTAIQLMSTPATRSVFSHTGWRHDGKGWVYLYQGGAVGASDLEVRLDTAFERFALPERTEDAGGAVRLALEILSCGPSSVTFPLLGAVFAAPLASILNPDFAVWLVGRTGSLKSELAAIGQRFFGLFERKTLPGSWSSTSNALERQLWVTKDMLSVVDDFAPQADGQAQREQTKRAESVLRNVGNHTGRARLRADLSQRPVRPPRGLVLCTGEDHPPTPSIVARLVIVEVDRSQLDLQAIGRLQATGHRLRHAMRAFIEWLRPRFDELGRCLPGELADLMSHDFSAALLGSHLRAPSGLATLYLGLDVFLRFAEDIGVVTSGEAAEGRSRARETLLALGRQQGGAARPENNQAARYLEILRMLLGQRRAWLRDLRATGSGVAGRASEFIGWRDEGHAYLLPEAARRLVATFLQEQGETWKVSDRRLQEALVKMNAVVPGAGGGPLNGYQIGGVNHLVMKIPADVLLEADAPTYHE